MEPPCANGFPVSRTRPRTPRTAGIYPLAPVPNGPDRHTVRHTAAEHTPNTQRTLPKTGKAPAPVKVRGGGGGFPAPWEAVRLPGDGWGKLRGCGQFGLQAVRVLRCR
ncbi:hypothetical protein GCM10009603_53790 [Nocardiopsis exhalans]